MKKKRKKKGVDELDAVSGRVGLRCGDLGAVSVLSSLGSTETAGRVLHWIPMRGVATNVAARASVLRMSFFFFLGFVLTRLRFTPNRADLARIRSYWPNWIV